MDVAYFREKRAGPEAVIEEAVADRLADFVSSDARVVLAAGSPPIGGGLPDLIVVSCEQEVFALAHVSLLAAEILAYLRAVRRANIDTITERVRRPRAVILRSLDELTEVKAVQRGGNAFSLNQVWREIMPEVVTIEAKVSKWRYAVSQAARNRLFSHRSFVAFPAKLALKIRDEPIISDLGLGILSVDQCGGVEVTKKPRRTRPRIWVYYYKLASLLATQHGGEFRDLSR